MDGAAERDQLVGRRVNCRQRCPSRRLDISHVLSPPVVLKTAEHSLPSRRLREYRVATREASTHVKNLRRNNSYISVSNRHKQGDGHQATVKVISSQSLRAQAHTGVSAPISIGVPGFPQCLS